MLAWSSNGERCRSADNLRLINLGSEHLYVDRIRNGDRNLFAKAFGVTVYGTLAVKDDANIVMILNRLRNIFELHHLVCGFKVTSVNDENFLCPLKSYENIYQSIVWSDLDLVFSEAHERIYELCVDKMRNFLSPEDFFRMFPSTGCPYHHCWNDDIDDIESTCTLCEGFRSRSRSPRVSLAQRNAKSPRGLQACLDGRSSS